MKSLKIFGGIALAFAGAICNQIAHQVGYYNTILNWVAIAIMIAGISLILGAVKQNKKMTHFKKAMSPNSQVEEDA